VEPAVVEPEPAPADARQAVRQPEPHPESTNEPASEARPSRVQAQPEQPVQPRSNQMAKAAQDKQAAPSGKSMDLDALMAAPVDDDRAEQRVKSPSERALSRADEPETTAAQSPTEQPAPEVRGEPARPTYDDARLEREMRMLKVAESVLRTNPERALRLARQGEKEFPGSMFTQERQQVLLLALVELGRMDEARRLAKSYLRKYPKGPFSDRVRRALATGTVR
jgi:hypothetical protein